MDLSGAVKETDSDSDEATHVDRRETTANFTIMTDKTILMFNNTLNAESKLVETYTAEITTVDVIWKGVNGLTRLTGGID